MDIAVNSFIKGLNRDISKTKYSSESYYDGLNIRIVTDNELSTLCITNEAGMDLSFRMPQVFPAYELRVTATTGVSLITINGASYLLSPVSSVENLYNKLVSYPVFKTAIQDGYYRIFNKGEFVSIVGLDTSLSVTTNNVVTTVMSAPTALGLEIIGAKQLRNYLILFSTNQENINDLGDQSSPGPGMTSIGTGQIWKLEIDDDGTIIDLAAGNYLKPSAHLLYHGYLDFDKEHLITAVSSFETNEVGKIYWADNKNTLRHINVLDDENLGNEYTAFDLIKPANFGALAITDIVTGGTYKTGVVQYSFQYYDVHGASSAFSPASLLYSLTPTSEDLGSSLLYYGGEREKVAGKTLQVSLTGLDRTFTNVRVIALHYESETSTPAITVVDERRVPSTGAYVFYDSGNSVLGTVTVEEFLTMGSIGFVPKALTIKDSMLLIGGINEDVFDVDAAGYWDSRAYRFKKIGSNGRQARLYSANLVDYLDISPAQVDTVPEEHDCIQTFAMQSSVTGIGTDYRFTEKTGALEGLGAYGKNIRVTIQIDPILADQYGDGWIESLEQNSSLGVYAGYSNYNNSAGKRSWQRNEMYRIGIEFIDNKGRWSYAKWVCDMKMPAITEEMGGNRVTYYGNTITNSSGIYSITQTIPYYDFGLIKTTGAVGSQKVYVNRLKLNVELLNGLPTDAVGYRIVMVKRTESHSRVVGQSVVFKWYQCGESTNRAYSPELPTLSSIVELQKIVPTNPIYPFAEEPIYGLAIPEALFYDRTFSGVTVKPLGAYAYASEVFAYNYGATAMKCMFYFKKTAALSGTRLLESSIRNEEFTADVEIFTVGNIDCRNYVFRTHVGPAPGAEQAIYYSDATKALVIHTENLIDVTSISQPFLVSNPTIGSVPYNSILLVNLERDLPGQYGGQGYDVRLHNEYIACSEFTDNLSVNAFGDIFINFMDYQYAAVDLGGWPSASDSIPFYFPVESRINLELRHDLCFHRTKESNVQQFAGLHLNVGNTSTYQQPTDLYLYNNAYSRQNDVKVFVPKPINFSDNTIFDTRIIASAVKHNNEEIDSWLQYFANVFVDIDGEYGPINKLITFNDKVICFQDRAIGTAAVNEEALTKPDGTGSSLSLGKGGVLDKYTYISTTSGSKHGTSVVASANGVYYYDILNNRFGVISENGTSPISELKGVASVLKNNNLRILRKLDTPITGYGVVSVHDKRNNRILFSVLDHFSQYEFTLGYNELTQTFESFYSFKPRIYLTHDDLIFSPDPVNPDTIYLHNVGDPGLFYGDIFESTITPIVNRDPLTDKVWASLAYNMEQTPDSLESFFSIQAYNDYQDTGIVELTPDNSRKRSREFHYTIPRNAGTTERMRSQYLLVKMLYDNLLGTKFKLHDLTTSYFPQSRTK
jgi:hypothetical protein